MSSPLLEVNHLKKYFKTRSGMLHAVDDVSFVLQPGETLGVVGESGCGKSTLGRTLVRLLDPTSGEIRFKGTDISGIKGSQLKDLRTHIQMIFQDPFSSLNPRKTVRESILEPLRLNGRHSAVEMEERVNELMDTVGLAQRLAYSYPSSWTADVDSVLELPGHWRFSLSSSYVMNRYLPWTSLFRHRF